ncbi:MAG: DUF5711 family protein [Ruminococcus flavefaciens]|nr:DUF5711 family protein [Ruminococcus flavefaciens]MCM1229411.1 DUF5711 family protein [Ruminococcus flavefaciens]
MPMYDMNDMVELKKRKKRRKMIIRLIIFMVIAVLASSAYLTKEMWLPKLRGLGKQYTTIVNDGRLAEGNFPIEINGGVNYQTDCSGGNLVVLSDAYIYFYSEEGGLIKKRQHAYTNAVMSAVDDEVLIYEHSGNRFSVEDRNDIVYSKELDENIIFARLSSEGYTAVVTKSENYECEVTVYDDRGEVIYERKCVQKVSDISFTDKSSGCIIGYIYAENGSIVTSVQKAVFTESGEKWTSQGLDTLGLNVYGYDGGAFVLGMDACGYVDTSGQISSFYRYDGDLADGSSDGGQSAVIINSDDRRRYIMALFDGGGTEPIILSFETPLIDVVVNDGLAYVMTQNAVLAYDFTGSLRSTASVNDSYTGFVRSSNYVFLKSFSKIDRINYES